MEVVNTLYVWFLCVAMLVIVDLDPGVAEKVCSGVAHGSKHFIFKPHPSLLEMAM